MSRALETYLVKLYLDRDARQAFLAGPRGVATKAGLDEKRAQEPRRRWARLLTRVRAWRAEVSTRPGR